MFGQPFKIKASAFEDYRRGPLSFFDAATSPLAVLSRTGVLNSFNALLLFLRHGALATMSTQEPPSTTHRRDPVATSPKAVGYDWPNIAPEAP